MPAPASAQAFRKGTTVSRPTIAKLLAPRTSQVVRRPRIAAELDRALRSGSCWVAAPGGYGKTTALADYLQEKAQPHVWYRADEGDQDIAGFFHYLAQSAHDGDDAPALPVFGPEYADQPQAFARRFFRAYFAALPEGALLVLDDLHYADAAPFRAVLSIRLRELPESVRCACLSRTLPPPELADLKLAGRLSVIDRSTLEFTEAEAREMVAARARNSAPVDVSAAHGWAVGLVLIAQSSPSPAPAPYAAAGDESAIFDALGQRLYDTLPEAERELLPQLSLFPEITADLAAALGAEDARGMLNRLHQRQLLVSGGEPGGAVFRMHDLLRDFLRHRLARDSSADALAQLQLRVAGLLEASGRDEAAIELALQAGAWDMARRLIAAQAATLLAQGRRATLTDWCARLPQETLDAWLCYWLGVANIADDAVAETWLSRAWTAFAERGETRGQCLAAAQAVLSKTDSWRTHDGLSEWTQRALALLDGGLPALPADEELLVLAGMLRALDFSEDYSGGVPARQALTRQLLARLRRPGCDDSTSLRLLASETLIEHAGSSGQADVFAQAVDSVAEDLREREPSPWALGLWLVAFGAVSGRYFPYSRRDFPYASAEAALRAAIGIGERESLRGVEFGALYHLQMQRKLCNDLAEFDQLIGRLAQIADSRYTTQVAVVADCQAALHTLQGNLADAHQACERFMTAIEAANEPPIERWPHFVTRFQVLLADRRPDEAAAFLEGLIALFDGGVRQRTQACIDIARAAQAKWRDDPDYPARLRAAFAELRAADWSAILSNSPALLAELCADALEHDIEPDFVRGLIAKRNLSPPPSRPRRWPWALSVRVLGEFGLQRDGAELDLGAKPPTRSLDLVRALAIANDRTCSLESLYDWLWPDADGDNAKASCEQALHRLRKLLGSADLVVQREGKLRLAQDKVWVDLEVWERQLQRAFAADAQDPSGAALEAAFLAFGGPLLQHERAVAWSLPAAERVRSKYLDLTVRLGARRESRGDFAAAQTAYLRALDFYPASTRLYEALIRARLAQGDRSGALEDYGRFERIRQVAFDTPASAAIRGLIAPLLNPSPR